MRCLKCHSELVGDECLACGYELSAIPPKPEKAHLFHDYYKDNRAFIVSDLQRIGREQTLERWGMGEMALNTLLKQETTAQAEIKTPVPLNTISPAVVQQPQKPEIPEQKEEEEPPDPRQYWVPADWISYEILENLIKYWNGSRVQGESLERRTLVDMTITCLRQMQLEIEGR